MAKETSVFGIYASRENAENGVERLACTGFRHENISVLLQDNAGIKDVTHEKHTKAPEGAATGVLAGGVIGGALGLLAHIGVSILEHFEIILKGISAACRELIPGLRPRDDFLPIGDVTGLMQRAQMGDEVAVAHFEFGLEVLKRPMGARGKQGHDGEPSLFMDEFVEPVKVEHSEWFL